ncbi:MAG: EAL domain-containing protein [Gammaproteobacteria bacterium]
MNDNNKRILSVIDGLVSPSVQETCAKNSVTEDLLDEMRVATWHWNCELEEGSWIPAAPGWLPIAALASAKALLKHIHPHDQEFLAAALQDVEQTSFETQARIHHESEEYWLHIHGKRDPEHPEQMVLAVRDVSAVKSLQRTLQQQIRRHQEMVRDTEAIAFEFELPDWNVRHIDRQIEALLGYPTADWLRRPQFLKENVFTDDWSQFEELTEADDDNAERYTFEFRIRTANGELRWMRIAGRRIPAGRLSPPRVRGILQDVSKSRLAIEKQQISEKQLSMLYDENPSMFFSMDGKGIVLSVNRYGAEHLGYRPEELIGRKAQLVHLPSQRSVVKERFAECVQANGEVIHWETCLVRADDTPLWVRVAARATGEGQRSGILAVCEDITEARALSDKLEYQSRYDLLTGLANRANFEQCLNQALESAKENLWEHVLCYIDLDQFKIINDTCGHSSGDQMLRRVGHMLSKYLREEDMLARLGGDEFGILFHRCDIENARLRAEEINQYLASQRFRWDQNNFRVTASVGMVAITSRSQSTEHLLSVADTACYAAKDLGRNRVYCSVEDDDAEITRRHGEMSWVARLQSALDGDGFEVYSQLIQPLDGPADDGHSIEILLRLKDFQGDVILPERFIRAAENYHIATRLDRWVCEHVVHYFDENADSLKNFNFVCVNLSAQSVTDNEFKTRLILLLEGRRHIAEKLCFEITETGVIENLDAATDFIKCLRDLGCRFALDDFGSGVSSFAYLKSLDVDIVKIDGMFVKHMVNDSIDRALVGSINDIGHAMGKQTIAEYVEDEDTQRCLKQLGVDFAQGFHIHKPEPLAEQMDTLSLGKKARCL